MAGVVCVDFLQYRLVYKSKRDVFGSSNNRDTVKNIGKTVLGVGDRPQTGGGTANSRKNTGKPQGEGYGESRRTPRASAQGGGQSSAPGLMRIVTQFMSFITSNASFTVSLDRSSENRYSLYRPPFLPSLFVSSSTNPNMFNRLRWLWNPRSVNGSVFVPSANF